MARILVVDDEKHIVRLVEVNLTQKGHTVEKAFDGIEGLEKVKSFSPDLIVLDRMMPKMDGMEMMRELQANPETADIPVIFLTAKAQDGDVMEGWMSGASSYLTKPFNPRELLLFVDRILTPIPEDGYEQEKIWDV